jgi:hypothetical protein
MPKRPSRRPDTRAATNGARRERQLQRKALRAQLREEKEIQGLTRKLQRAIESTNDRYQALAMVLSSHARAIEAERDAALAVK